MASRGNTAMTAMLRRAPTRSPTILPPIFGILRFHSKAVPIQPEQLAATDGSGRAIGLGRPFMDNLARYIAPATIESDGGSRRWVVRSVNWLWVSMGTRGAAMMI
ncbi:MAG: hypothetical protein QOH05_2238 [Acetobacteraceae bacterium]|nr:hypothetical protein [Acetobacteraceae bacterium]